MVLKAIIFYQIILQQKTDLKTRSMIFIIILRLRVVES